MFPYLNCHPTVTTRCLYKDSPNFYVDGPARGYDYQSLWGVGHNIEILYSRNASSMWLPSWSGQPVRDPELYYYCEDAPGNHFCYKVGSVHPFNSPHEALANPFSLSPCQPPNIKLILRFNAGTPCMWSRKVLGYLRPLYVSSMVYLTDCDFIRWEDAALKIPIVMWVSELWCEGANYGRVIKLWYAIHKIDQCVKKEEKRNY